MGRLRSINADCRVVTGCNGRSSGVAYPLGTSERARHGASPDQHKERASHSQRGLGVMSLMQRVERAQQNLAAAAAPAAPAPAAPPPPEAPSPVTATAATAASE